MMVSDLSVTRQVARLCSGPLGGGLLVFLAMAAAGVGAAIFLDLRWRDLLPGEGGLRLAGDFLSHAWRPAVAFEGDYAPTGGGGLIRQVGLAVWNTVVFAGASISLAVAGGLVLGWLGSSAWWDDRQGRRGLGPWITALARLLMTLLRSVHELVWAVLLLAALGRSASVAVVAIALPYAGTLAKVYSEMIDEAPRPATRALAGAGASSLQQFWFALVPQALPDLLAYTFYRFECALRSAAVLGFFGFPTLGYYISASFENLHYGEVWTYLYALFALVVAVDAWSGRLRRELRS